MSVRIAGAAGLALALGACGPVAKAPPPDDVVSAAASAALETTPSTAAADEALKPNGPPQALPPTRSAPPAVRQNGTGTTVGRTEPSPRSGPTGAASNAQGDVTLNYADTDIREIIRVILGDTLHLNYTIDPQIQGTVSLQTKAPLKREDLLPTLESLVSQVGGVILMQNGVFRVSLAGNTAIVPPLVGPSTIADGSQVVPLRYASAKQLATMLTPYAGDGAQIIADPTRNVLIVTGTASARQSVIDLIHVFDVDYLAGQSYGLFPVKSGDPDKFAADLQHALGVDADGPLAGAIKVVPVVQANAVMVIAQAQSYLDRAARLIAQLNQVTDETARNVHVYYLRNTKATDLQPILQTAFNPPQAGGALGASGPGSLPPTAAPAQVASAPPAAGGLGAATTAGVTATGTGLTGGTGIGQSGASSIFGATTGGATGSTTTTATATAVAAAPGAPQIIANTAGNSLVVVATDSDYGRVDAAIRKLDVMPPQVLVEATIAEVTLNKALQYGTQFFFNSAEAAVTLSGAQSAVPTGIGTTPLSNSSLFQLPTFAPNFPGLAITRLMGNQQYAVQALESVTTVKVISAPKILILDQQPASIQVGSLVPIITQSAQSTIAAGSPVVNSVQYQPTGIILNVTPRIGTDGLVMLDIDQEVSSVVNTTSSNIDSPSFTERRVKSDVAVEDGQTIGLAGLISDNKSGGNSGIPVLRSIPVVGALFSTENDTDVRTELLVLITPHVVRDAREARGITEELKRKLTPAAVATPPQ